MNNAAMQMELAMPQYGNSIGPTPGLRYKDPETSRDKRIAKVCQMPKAQTDHKGTPLKVRMDPIPDRSNKGGAFPIRVSQGNLVRLLSGCYLSNGHTIARIICADSEQCVVHYPCVGHPRKQVMNLNRFIHYLNEPGTIVFRVQDGVRYVASGVFIDE